MITIHNLFDKYKSVSIERAHDFLTRKGIENQCTELRRIKFKLEDFSWDLYIVDNYVKIELNFLINKETSTDKKINRKIADVVYVEITKRIKECAEMIDEENSNSYLISEDGYNDYDQPTYEKYGGSYAQDEMGYSDDDIDTIFDGDPDAYWNID